MVKFNLRIVNFTVEKFRLTFRPPIWYYKNAFGSLAETKILNPAETFFPMTPQNNLELNGDLHDHPLAELLIEISQAFLNGSLRIASEENKAIIYFDGGEVVFAVSNARQHRLFNILLRENKFSLDELQESGNFTNDLELKNLLIEKNLLSAKELNEQISHQIEEILQTALNWKEGKWNYSSLVRAKADVRFEVDSASLLFEYGRNLPNAALVRRFNSLQERFETKPKPPAHINLHPQEAFVFSRFGETALSVEEIKNLSRANEIEILKTVYTLWLGGFLRRHKWNWAFSKEKIYAISTAKIALKKNKPLPALSSQPIETLAVETVEKAESVKQEEVQEQLSLESYLDRVENAATFYEIFDVSSKAPAGEIKSAYFSLAKRFHPDLFHRQTDDAMQRRIQNAFTKLAQAYETLKDEQSREVYNFKLGKGLTVSQNPLSNGTPSATGNANIEKQAAENFEQGFSYLMEERYEQAIQLLARAVHLAGNNARYRAYYGKALASHRNTYRQAETEFQAALRIEDNADYRLMLAELYVNIGLFKRAESELSRVLEKAPNNWEARSLLDSLRDK